MCGFHKFLPSLQYGAHFRHQRKLIHLQLGTRAHASRFGRVQDVESRRLLTKLLNNPNELEEHIHSIAAAVILKITYDYTVDPAGDDPLVALGDRMMEYFSKTFVPLYWIVDAIPPLRHLPWGFPGTSTFQRPARQCNDIIDSVVNSPYKFVREQMAQGVNKHSFVSGLVEKCTDKEGKLSEYDEESIKWCAGAMYGGASHTTIAILSTFIAAIIKHPEVQKVAQREMEDVLGPGVLNGQCIDTLPTIYIAPSINLVFDIIALILPQKVIWGLQLSWQKRLGVSFLLALGLLACVSAALRIPASVKFTRSDDRTHNIAPTELWCLAEMTAGILIYCMPSAPAALKRAKHVAKTSTQRLRGDSSAHSQNASKSKSSSGHRTTGQRSNPGVYREIDEIPLTDIKSSTSHSFRDMGKGLGGAEHRITRTTHITMTSSSQSVD